LSRDVQTIENGGKEKLEPRGRRWAVCQDATGKRQHVELHRFRRKGKGGVRNGETIVDS